MPLSEREQRLLDQMERALYAEDPKFASSLQKSASRSVNGRRIFLGVLILVAGLAGLLAGVASSAAALGVLGFVVMLCGVMVGVSSMRTSKPVADPASASQTDSPAPPAGGSSFMGKVEERWRRRRDGDDY